MVVHGFTFEPGTVGHVVSIPADTLARTLGPHGMGAQAAPALFALDEDDRTRFAALLSLATVEFASVAPGRAEALTALAALLALQVQRLLPGSSRRPAASDCPPREGADGARRSPRQPRDAQARLAQAFLAQVEADFRAQPALTDRARRLRVGVPHLSRVCRAVLGRSALAVVHDRLLLEARRHLVYTSMTVQEIAYGLGFRDPAYFTRFFTERTDRTPTEYRKDVSTVSGTQDP
jgi:AraC family transcriptional regulator, transcriptional activator of pobA